MYIVYKLLTYSVYKLYNVYMKIAEFRNNIRRYMDSLRETDDEIILERFGQQWKLTWIGGADDPSIEVKPTKSKTPGIKELTKIPGVVKAPEAVCKGTHFMSRKDCGKPGCPWAGIK